MKKWLYRIWKKGLNSDMAVLLKTKDLSKKYGNKLALNNVSITLESGKIVGLLGPNGSGKTTLIKLINKLLSPTSGEIIVNDKPLSVESREVISYLPDNNFLNSYMTVNQIVNYFSDFFKDFRKELAIDMLSKLDIDLDMKLKHLSKGNKEKVSLILIMSRNARLYILDEPIAAVDPATRDYIISTIINNYNPDAAVLICTHLISDIEPILDEAIFLNKGEVVLHKTVEDIREEGRSVDELFREVFKW